MEEKDVGGWYLHLNLLLRLPSRIACLSVRIHNWLTHKEQALRLGVNKRFGTGVAGVVELRRVN